jgi:hypothetical protein
MRFLHFHRTDDYMQYLCFEDVKRPKASDAYLHMTETDLFALDSEEGRRHAICNLLGLVKFWEEWKRQNGEVVKKTDIDSGDVEERLRQNVEVVKTDIDSGDVEERRRQNVEVVKTDIDSGDPEESEEGDSDMEKTESSGEELGRDDDDIDSGEESEEEDSAVDIDDSNDEDYNPRARKRMRRCS